MHGTTGSGQQFTRKQFVDELFGVDQPLDLARYYVILPDDIGHGRSSVKAVRNAIAMAYRFADSRFIERVEHEIAASTASSGVKA